MKKLIALTALVLCGCLPPPDGCPPEATRCSPMGIPQVCSASQRWTNVQDESCRVEAVCCLTPSVFDSTRTLHACVPQTACVEEAP
jgi:hypothetical protein